VLAVQDVKTEEKDGEEEKLGKARLLQATLGVRDRDRRVVEIVALEDPATRKRVSPAGLLFVTEGGQGLQTDDPVKLRDEAEKEAK
jgi:hypothetical protein